MFERIKAFFRKRHPEELPSQHWDGDWPFDQPRNCATVTMRQILDGTEPILLVSHDADDHGWQFIGSTGANSDDGRVVCLEHMVALDPSVLEVADLPPGWRAVRDSPQHPWQRSRKSRT